MSEASLETRHPQHDPGRSRELGDRVGRRREWNPGFADASSFIRGRSRRLPPRPAQRRACLLHLGHQVWRRLRLPRLLHRQAGAARQGLRHAGLAGRRSSASPAATSASMASSPRWTTTRSPVSRPPTAMSATAAYQRHLTNPSSASSRSRRCHSTSSLTTTPAITRHRVLSSSRPGYRDRRQQLRRRQGRRAQGLRGHPPRPHRLSYRPPLRG